MHFVFGKIYRTVDSEAHRCSLGRVIHQNLAVCILGHINYAAQFIQFINGTFQIIQTTLDGFDFCIDSGDLALKLGLCGGDGCGDSLIDNTTISNRILDSLLISCCELGLCSFKCCFLFFKGRLDLGIVVGGNLCINSCKLGSIAGEV